MHPRKLFGIVFILAAAAGVTFCIYAVVQVWRIRPAITQTVADSLNTLDETLTTTQDGLTNIGQVVQATNEDVESINSTIQALSLAMQDTNEILGALTTLTGTDLPAMVAATQTSLASAQNSALLIDDILTALTGIPFLGMAVYQPDVPLHLALAEISSSLDPLTPSLDTISTSLASASTDLDSLEIELQAISDTTQEVNDALSSIQTTLTDYQTLTTEIKDWVAATQPVMPSNIRTGAWMLTFLLVSLMFVQFGLGAQGLDMLRSSHPPLPDTPSGESPAGNNLI